MLQGPVSLDSTAGPMGPEEPTLLLNSEVSSFLLATLSTEEGGSSYGCANGFLCLFAAANGSDTLAVADPHLSLAGLVPGPPNTHPSPCRPGTHSSSAAHSQPMEAAGRGARHPCSCSSSTACGRSCASSPAPSSSTNSSSSCSSSMPMPPSLGHFWATTRVTGRSPAHLRGDITSSMS